MFPNLPKKQLCKRYFEYVVAPIEKAGYYPISNIKLDEEVYQIPAKFKIEEYNLK